MKHNFSLFGLLVIVVFLVWVLGELSMTSKAPAQEKTPPTLLTPEMKCLAEFYVGT
jgi:hypothetical protein